MRLLLVVFLLLLTPSAAVATTDAERLGLHRQAAERYVAGYTKCPRVTYHLNATAPLDAWYPPTAFEHADGAAYDDDPRAGALACSVWVRGGLPPSRFRETLTHEILHTAGWDHGLAMDAHLANILRVRP